MWAVAGENSKDAMDTISLSKQSKTVFWGKMENNSRKRYFHIDRNTNSNKYMLY